MKPRHAAALALVGWYLMTPHLKNDQSADMKVPISHWYFYNERRPPDPNFKKTTRTYAFIFHSQQECEEKRSSNLAWEHKLRSKVRWMECSGCFEIWQKAICISDDDSRLNGN
jgi:hypothetical protein